MCFIPSYLKRFMRFFKNKNANFNFICSYIMLKGMRNQTILKKTGLKPNLPPKEIIQRDYSICLGIINIKCLSLLFSDKKKSYVWY